MVWWAKRIPSSCQNQSSFSDKHVYRRYTFPDFKVFWVNKWTYLPHGCFLRGVFGTASELGAFITRCLMRIFLGSVLNSFKLARRKAETDNDKSSDHELQTPTGYGFLQLSLHLTSQCPTTCLFWILWAT